jgi:hypothetical protein
LVEVTAVAAVVVLLVEVAVAVAGVVDGVVVVSVAAKSGEIDINDNIVVQSKIGHNLINIFFITNSFLSELNFFV